MKKLLVSGVAALALSTTATAQDEKHFDGAYIGAETGYQDSGNGLNGLYYGATLGFRKQTNSDLVYGIEGNFGKADVDVAGFNNIIDNQWSIHGTVGWAFGAEKRDLFTLGAGYVGVKVSAGGLSDTGTAFPLSLDMSALLARTSLSACVSPAMTLLIRSLAQVASRYASSPGNKKGGPKAAFPLPSASSGH